MWISLLLVLVLGPVFYVGVPWCYTRYLRRRAATRCRSQNLIALTFDDGPGARLTPRILECLAEARVPATFFLLTRNAAGRESLIRRALELGHAIGCHGDQHVHQWKTVPWAGIRDIRACWQRVREITGRDASRMPFRPPFGKLSLPALLYLWAHRTPIAMWTLDGGDTTLGVPVDPEAVVKQLRQAQGGVLLLHDFDRGEADEDEKVLSVVRAVLPLGRGPFRFTTLERVLP